LGILILYVCPFWVCSFDNLGILILYVSPFWVQQITNFQCRDIYAVQDDVFCSFCCLLLVLELDLVSELKLNFETLIHSAYCGCVEINSVY
jgi:hypothetical protein